MIKTPQNNKSLLTALMSLMFFLSVNHAYAEETNTNDAELSSNIYGGQEVPLDMNIMPWRQTTAELKKPDITSSILERILQPIDRASLKREIDFIERSKE